MNGPLPVFKLQKADCEEIGKGNKDISLCVGWASFVLAEIANEACAQAKDTEPAVAAPLLVSNAFSVLSLC